jgi:DNA mismatch repair ATPase MutS
VPSEAKSAFALEMDDVRVVLRDCTRRSLVMIDELGESYSVCTNVHTSSKVLSYVLVALFVISASAALPR